MLLVVKNQTFFPFGVTIRIINLIDVITNNIVHGFR
jgi:hypothetical protein